MKIVVVVLHGWFDGMNRLVEIFGRKNKNKDILRN